jgi:concanavalin A-like lectin/glucanase superfamily protein
MPTNKYMLVLIVFGSLVMGSMLSCKKNDNPAPNYNADKTKLKALIDSLTTVYNNSVEGSHAGDYVVGARAALDSVINLAVMVNSTNTFTQEQVNNAYNNLERAGAIFSTQQLLEVSPEHLMGYWKCNGNANDSSGNGNNGLLRTNWVGASASAVVDGGTLPQLVADRFGNASSAYYFNNGATIEVPYTSALNPKSMSISLWCKTDVISNGGDYMFALDRWYGYKLNLQTSNFLYFTVFHGFDQNNNGIWVMDDDGGSNSAVPLSTWVHAVVSYDNASSTAKFYFNGKLVKTLPNKTGPPVTLTNGYNVTIGNELPKVHYNLTDSNNPDYYWGPDYFIGSLDDIRFYNSALTDNEVLSIYTMENSPN